MTNQCKISEHFFVVNATVCTCGVLRRNADDKAAGFRRPTAIQSRDAAPPAEDTNG